MFPIIKIQLVWIGLDESLLNLVFKRILLYTIHIVSLTMLFQHPLPAQPLLVCRAMACFGNNRSTKILCDRHGRNCHAGHDGKGKDALSDMVLLYMKHLWFLLGFLLSPLSYMTQRTMTGIGKGKGGFFS